MEVLTSVSILKRFLGIAEAPPREKIPRAARIRLQNIHHLILTSPRWDGQIINVINISTTGVGVENSHKPDDLNVGSVFPAMLTLNQKTYPVLLRVAQVTESLVGCSFEGDTGQLQKAVFDYFVAEISGMDVTQVNSKLLKPDSRGDVYWYFGSNNSEVYFTRAKNQISYFHITLLGNYIECYADQPPKYGYVVTQEGENKMKPDQSSLIRFTEEMPEATLELFIKFVRHIQYLKTEERSYLLNILEELRAEQHSKNLQV